MSHSYPTLISYSVCSLLLLLISCTAAQPAASQPLRAQAGAYTLEVLVDGDPARSYQHGGETHILGRSGQRYILRVHNRSDRRVEAVVSVDGLDVMDGKAGDFVHKRGYLVPAYGHVDIEGFRLSDHEAAAFRFAAVEDSYAAKTGDTRNVGVIGVALFRERRVQITTPPYSYRPQERPKAAVRDEEFSLGAPHEAEAPSAAPSKGALGKRSTNPAPAPAGSGAAPSAESSADSALADSSRARRGLGTEFGEAVSSTIREVPFTREQRNTPTVLLGARYNDRAGLLALGIDVDGDGSDLALRQSANPFPHSQRRYAQPPLGWQR